MHNNLAKQIEAVKRLTSAGAPEDEAIRFISTLLKGHGAETCEELLQFALLMARAGEERAIDLLKAEAQAKADEIEARLTAEIEALNGKLRQYQDMPALGPNLMHKPPPEKRALEESATGRAWTSQRGQLISNIPNWVKAEVVQIIANAGGLEAQRSGAFKEIQDRFRLGGMMARRIFLEARPASSEPKLAPPEREAESVGVGDSRFGSAMPSHFLERA